jgi:ATP-dependent DNA helicase RecQ
MQMAANISKILHETLQSFWGHANFRDSQEEIIYSVINGKDTVALLPTGGGKSLCYQLPALLLEGTCLVISPLLALMKDQVQQLKSRGIEAEYLSSELDELQEEEIYGRCIEGITKLLYVSPERLQNSSFINRIEEITISFIAVDEAHCISEWGQDFRPSYQNIKKFRAQFKNVSCLALTATATPKVLEDVKVKLGFLQSAVFKKSFKRENIQIYNDEVADKYTHISDILKHNNSSGIIYTRTRKDAEELTHFLQSRNIKNVDYFHAGLSTKDKNSKQEKWLKSNSNVLVSTNAFGMGIDKDNVRFVIHLSPSASLENYYQEIGRAGRDGEKSYAFLLWNEQELIGLDDVLKNSTPNKNEFLKIISYLYSKFMVAENELPEQIFELHTSKIQDFTKISQAKIKNVLNFLHNQELVYINTSKKLSTLELKFEVNDLESLSKKDGYFIELLLRNIDGLSSHKAHFSEANLCKKLGVESKHLKDRLREVQQKNFVEYLDGSLHSIRFLKPREDRSVEGKWWNLFEQIQKNKLQKWEEMKFYTRNTEFCKMKLILSYFGEKNPKDCGNCFVCSNKRPIQKKQSIENQILDLLKQKPATLDDLAVLMHFHQKEKLQNQLIFLLELGKIKMLDFRTYTIK